MAEPAKARPAAQPTGEGRTAVDIFAARVKESGDRPALRHKAGASWQQTSWSEWNQAAREIAGGLIGLGVGVGDRVVILSNTRLEWVMFDLGILQAGAIAVPIYPSNTPEQCEYIINDCGASIVVVEDPYQLGKLFDPQVRPKLGNVRKVVLITDRAELEKPDTKGRKSLTLADVGMPAADKDWLMAMADLRKAGGKWLETGAPRLDEIARALDPAQAATLIYTSGTTGPPKGVVLTHANLAFACNSVKHLLGLGSDDEQLLFLPLAHSFARVLEWAAISVGAVTAFAESLAKLVPNMQEVRPTFMGAVPRVYEKAFARIQANFEDKRKKPIPRLLIDWALRKGQERSRIEQKGGRADGLGVTLADKLVFDKVRQTFGGRLKFFISGGAPLSREIAEFFHAAGILILEGYGLTETTASGNVNRPDDYKFGTVGPAVPGVEIKIASDGEILIRGGNVMKEYYGQPEATAEAIDADGWFHSGDIGVIEDGRFLKITDRKKDIIVTAGGKNVAPQNIENEFKALCPYASQMMIYGDKRKYLSALITLAEDTLTAWAKEQGISFSSYADLTQKPEVNKLVVDHMAKLNANLASYESIKKWEILPKDFDQESGELTPTLKVKRKFCTEKYKDILEGFYQGPESAL